MSPGEPGGSSARGVSMTVLDEYNKAHGLPHGTIDEMKAMTAEAAGKIYTWRFADPIRFDDLPAGIDYRLMDAAITLGATGAVQLAQLALGRFPITGKMDDGTLDAIRAIGREEFLNRLNVGWIVWKRGLTPDGWKKYGHGWTNRNNRVLARALTLI